MKKIKGYIIIVIFVLLFNGCGQFKEEEKSVEEMLIAIDKNECASVHDGEMTLNLGMTLKDFNAYYNEEEIVSESTPTNLITNDVIEGKYYKWYFHDYEDISISTTNYCVEENLAEYDYIVYKFTLWTSRFHTSKGISVGSTLNELEAAYGENLELVEADRYEYKESDVAIRFFMEHNRVEKIEVIAMKYTSLNAK